MKVLADQPSSRRFLEYSQAKGERSQSRGGKVLAHSGMLMSLRAHRVLAKHSSALALRGPHICVLLLSTGDLGEAVLKKAAGGVRPWLGSDLRVKA